MLAQDVSPRVIMEVLGHSQISITMNTYSHISEAQSREAANRMGDLFQFTSGDPLAAVKFRYPLDEISSGTSLT